MFKTFIAYCTFISMIFTVSCATGNQSPFNSNGVASTQYVTEQVDNSDTPYIVDLTLADGVEAEDVLPNFTDSNGRVHVRFTLDAETVKVEDQ